MRTPATDADGGIRAGGDVAELTGLLDLTTGSPAVFAVKATEVAIYPV